MIMKDWQNEAMRAVAMAEYMNDEYRPKYRVPVARHWWEFWKIGKWETFEGMSRADGRRLQELMRP